MISPLKLYKCYFTSGVARYSIYQQSACLRLVGNKLCVEMVFMIEKYGKIPSH